MEPDYATLVPWDSQLAHWTMESAVWAPGLPVESAATEIFGSYLQTSVPTSSSGMQLVEYAADTQNDQIVEAAAQEFEVDFHNVEIKIHNNPIHVFEEKAREFKVSVDMMKMKIHRYPPSIRALGELYTVPTTVAIGPYHHDKDKLKPAEKVKHVAAYHCIRESGRSVQEMYDAVVSVADDARSLYAWDARSLNDNDFLPMMFYDACFLVQYMLSCTHAGFTQMDPALRSFFYSNDNDILRDIMLLENQLPWRVVEAVIRFRPVSLKEFVVSLRGCLQDRKVHDEKTLVFDESYEPPHLLGLLRPYIVGKSDAMLPTLPETVAISFSVSAIELAEIGVKLTPNKTTELIHMDLKKRNLFAKISLTPLSLDVTRASLLLNMAALELCTTSNFQEAKDEESAVCSYLLLLAMMVDREEDVHELRARRILQGAAGLTNKEALNFLTGLHGLRLGSRYVRTMKAIESYKVKKSVRIKVYAFVYKNMKTIVTVISVTAAVVGILGTLKSLKAVH